MAESEKIELTVEAKAEGLKELKDLKTQLEEIDALLKTLKGQSNALKNLFDTGGSKDDIRAAKREITATIRELRNVGGAKPITDNFRAAPSSAGGVERLLGAIEGTQGKTSRVEALIQGKELEEANERLAKAESAELDRKVELLKAEYDEREKIAKQQESELEKADKLVQNAEERLQKEKERIVAADSRQEKKELADLFKAYDQKEKQQAKDAAAAEKESSALAKLRESARAARIEFAKMVGLKMLTSPMLNPFAGIAKGIKGALGALSKLQHMVGRVLAYRALRKAFALISQGVKEGIENLYAYSQNLGTVFHSNMDRMKESALLVKNATAAMIGPIINAVTPALERLADLFANIANQIGFFIAKLTGAASFSAAIRGNLSSAASAAKDLKKQVFGFDELNILNAPSGGGAATNAGGYFEEWKTGEGGLASELRAAFEAQNFTGAGKILASKLNEMIANLPTEKWGASIGSKINNAISLANGFLKDFSFQKLGGKIGSLINSAITTLGAEGTWTKIGENAAHLLTGAFDLIGGLIKNIEPAGLGDAVKGILTGWFNSVYEWLTGLSWVKIGNEFVEYLKGVVTGGEISWGDVATSIFKTLGAAIGAAVGLLAGAAHNVITSIVDYFKQFIDVDEHDSLLAQGTAIIIGIKDGLVNAVKGIAAWLWTNVISPFWQGIKSGFGIQEDGHSSIAFDFGDGIMGDMLDGFFKGWRKIKDWLQNTVKPAISQFFQDPLSQYGNLDFDVRDNKRTGTGIRKWASGGFPDQGSLFIANEAGPELVGTIGNRTAVTNQAQFTQGLYNANMPVVSAVIDMAQSIVTAINNKDTSTYLDGRELASSLYKPLQRVASSRGPVLVR